MQAVGCANEGSQRQASRDDGSVLDHAFLFDVQARELFAEVDRLLESREGHIEPKFVRLMGFAVKNDVVQSRRLGITTTELLSLQELRTTYGKAFAAKFTSVYVEFALNLRRICVEFRSNLSRVYVEFSSIYVRCFSKRGGRPSIVFGAHVDPLRSRCQHCARRGSPDPAASSTEGLRSAALPGVTGDLRSNTGGVGRPAPSAARLRRESASRDRPRSHVHFSGRMSDR